MLNKKQKEMKLQSLQVQLDFLDTLRTRHLMWVNDSNLPEMMRLHLEIIELIRQMRAKYNELLDMYPQHTFDERGRRAFTQKYGLKD